MADLWQFSSTLYDKPGVRDWCLSLQDEYQVEHSGAIIILNPKGEYQAVFTDPDHTTPTELATDLAELIDFAARTL